MVLKIAEALQALSFGEVLPVFAPEKNNYAKKRLLELKAQMRALEHVEYRVARGMTRLNAQEEVAGVYGISRETIASWGKRIRHELGKLEVAARLQRVKNIASHAKAPRCDDPEANDPEMVPYAEALYGASALARSAADFHGIARREAQRSMRKEGRLRT